MADTRSLKLATLYLGCGVLTACGEGSSGTPFSEVAGSSGGGAASVAGQASGGRGGESGQTSGGRGGEAGQMSGGQAGSSGGGGAGEGGRSGGSGWSGNGGLGGSGTDPNLCGSRLVAAEAFQLQGPLYRMPFASSPTYAEAPLFAIEKEGSYVTFVDTPNENDERYVDLVRVQGGITTTLASKFRMPWALEVAPDGSIVFVHGSDGIRRLMPSGQLTTLAAGEYVTTVAASPDGKYVYFSSNRARVSRVAVDTNQVELVATKLYTLFSSGPEYLAFGHDPQVLYATNADDGDLYRIEVPKGAVDGNARVVRLGSPTAWSQGKAGDHCYYSGGQITGSYQGRLENGNGSLECKPGPCVDTTDGTACTLSGISGVCEKKSCGNEHLCSASKVGERCIHGEFNYTGTCTSTSCSSKIWPAGLAVDGCGAVYVFDNIRGMLLRYEKDSFTQVHVESDLEAADSRLFFGTGKGPFANNGLYQVSERASQHRIYRFGQ